MSEAVVVDVHCYRHGVASALVDAEDVEKVNAFRWHTRDGYAVGRTPTDPVTHRRLNVSMHRIVLDLVPGDGLHVHHVNGDPLDNRKANLLVFASAAEHRRYEAAGMAA